MPPMLLLRRNVDDDIFDISASQLFLIPASLILQFQRI